MYIMRKKKHLVIVAVLFGMFLLTGCSSEKSASDNPEKDDHQTQQEVVVSGQEEQTEAHQNQESDEQDATEQMTGENLTGDGYSTMQAINQWSQESTQADIQAVLEKYQQYSALECYSSEDGILVYAYTFRKQQEYTESPDEVKAQYKANMEKGRENLLSSFASLKEDGIVLKGFEYIYYNPDGTLICDLLVAEDGSVSIK